MTLGNSQMPALLTAGQFATLARTTKRTVQLYDRLALLKPIFIDPANHYRYYDRAQIIDFQVILLLRNLNVSIKEIQGYLAKDVSLKHLFESQQSLLKQKLVDLESSLRETETCYRNLSNNGTLVDPVVKKIASMEIVYLEKIGPYSQIGEYFSELNVCFSSIPQDTVFLTTFDDAGYNPQKAKLKIAAVLNPGLKIKANKLLKTMTIPKFKALTHTHLGSSKLLSLLWQEVMSTSARVGYKPNNKLPFVALERYFYAHTPVPAENLGHYAEIVLPIQ